MRMLGVLSARERSLFPGGDGVDLDPRLSLYAGLHLPTLFVQLRPPVGVGDVDLLLPADPSGNEPIHCYRRARLGIFDLDLNSVLS